MVWSFILILLSSCSGYRMSQQDNPLAQYGIKSVSLPMFFNYSNQTDASSHFTKETYRLLSAYKGLKLKNGYRTEADAVLIGIIKSPEKISLTTQPNNLRFAQNRAANAIGSTREKFYIPGTTDISLYLHVILIKKPSDQELMLLQSGIGDQIKASSRIIFNELIPLRGQYAREVFDNSSTSDAVSVTATQNAGIQRKVIRNLSEQAAISIRDLILYAF
jgi:hypothetical protein